MTRHNTRIPPNRNLREKICYSEICRKTFQKKQGISIKIFMQIKCTLGLKLQKIQKKIRLSKTKGFITLKYTCFNWAYGFYTKILLEDFC